MSFMINDKNARDLKAKRRSFVGALLKLCLALFLINVLINEEIKISSHKGERERKREENKRNLSIVLISLIHILYYMYK